MAQLYTRKAQVTILEEATPGTYQPPDGSGTGMILAEITDTPLTLNGQNHVPRYSRGDYLSMDERPGAVYSTLSFRFPLRGSGDAGDITPNCEPALKAAGMLVDNTAGQDDVYTPTSTFDSLGGNPHQSYSCSILENGIRWAAKDGFGTFSISATPGEPVYVDYQFHGGFVPVADDALEAPTYRDTTPPAFMGASLTLGGVTPKGVAAFNFDLGNEFYHGLDVNDTYGYYGSRITGRKSSGSLQFESDLVATRDDFGLWTAGTVAAFTTGDIGGTAGNIWSLALARVTRRTPELVAQDNVRHVNIPFGVGSAPDDVEDTNADVTLTIK